jgi:hypothetical protein
LADNSVKPVDNSAKPAEFQVFNFFLFLSWLNFVSIDFFWFLPNFACCSVVVMSIVVDARGLLQGQTTALQMPPSLPIPRIPQPGPGDGSRQQRQQQ